MVTISMLESCQVLPSASVAYCGHSSLPVHAGGANVPALNDLLAPYGIAYGDSIVQGSLQVAGMNVHLAHGADIARMPAGSYLHKGAVTSHVGSQHTDKGV